MLMQPPNILLSDTICPPDQHKIIRDLDLASHRPRSVNHGHGSITRLHMILIDTIVPPPTQDNRDLDLASHRPRLSTMDMEASQASDPDPPNILLSDTICPPDQHKIIRDLDLASHRPALSTMDMEASPGFI
ncbi:hypothetical protein J6590_105155 [Homalodisca vitripennis]|nr:hypothetical protein J6590_105155 [Homalodisca vitripennis]